MLSLHLDTALTWRGGQNQVLLTVLGLRARGHRTALVAHPNGELHRRASKSPDLFSLDPYMEIDLRAAWKLSRLIHQLKPDIVHAHDARGVAITAQALQLVKRSHRTKFVAARRVDFHVAKNAFSRWKYKQVDRFICASEFIKTMLIEDGIPAGRTTVIYEGIDLAKAEMATSLNLHREFSLPNNDLIVGNVAALVPHKGQRYLIDAASLVIKKIPGTRFLIAGEGKLEQTLRDQVNNLKLDQHVIFTGFRSDVLSLHKGFDIFAMSSVTEGLCTSVLDAMACGRPVVASRTGGLQEAVEDTKTGILVPPSEPDALATALVKILQDQTLRNFYGHNARENALQRFSAERMVDETVSVYQHLVDTPRAEDSSGLQKAL